MEIRDDQLNHIGTTEELVPSQSALPSDDPADKASRKRERELSMEPATPHRTPAEIESENSDPKDRRTPAKKNRTSTQLDATEEEEEEESGSGVSESPPTESKIRQISQGVEDMTWKHIRKDSTSERDHEMDVHNAETKTDHQITTEVSDTHEGVAAQRGDDLEEEPIKAKVAGGDEVAVPPVLLQGENPPQIIDNVGEDEHAGQADPAEVPPDAQPSDPAPLFDNPEVHPEVSATSAIPPVPPSSSPHSRRSSESEAEAEKGLKRKLRDRTVSERFVPGEVEEHTSATAPKAGATKRQRDDADSDANPRVTKRPTPPPEESEGNTEKVETSPSHSNTTPATPSTSKISGFMAYASTSSPFASVAGPSVFNKSKTPPASSSPFASTSTSFASAFATTPSSSPTKSSTNSSETPLPQKRTGFEAFASTSSPFASVAKRPKSPPPPAFGGLARSRSPSRHPTSTRSGNAFSASAFSAYAAGGAQGFSASKPRSERASPAPSEGSTRGTSVFDAGTKDDAEEESGNGAVSFSERLRSHKDDEDSEESDRVKLTEQEVHTGEEDEETMYQVRGKLYALSAQNQWKERGTGMLKLNVRREDGTGARLIMRKEAVYTVLLNATLFKGMKCFIAQDPRYIRFSVFESGTATHYNLRVQSAKAAEELIDEINSHIPGE
ncbi:uncharacterized protein C8Q71DRAFT_776937 [Rhodofomes roseus]|uniref:RanBD1 domain-containing protein n=1 Tax=Rhodofomes roseus TaxID=34475 RepID=A0ABQ8K633_9APHY|nr:uncharacterized protein C8Q71DRAFT_776937 [Rhodofomes roseus]KAH9832541.1 hypothetical protein C8Q71DRAFT_776937 [Rhodofomes roseus]